MRQVGAISGLFCIETALVNVHVIVEDGQTTLIDTGWRESVRRIEAALCMARRRSIELPPVQHIVLTHAHADHAGGLSRLLETIDPKPVLYAHAEALRFLRDRTPGDHPLRASPGLVNRAMTAMLNSVPMRLEEVALGDAVEVRDGEVIPAAGGMRVLHIPGHSRDQIALIWPTRRVLFAADAMSGFGGGSPSIAHADPLKALDSIGHLLEQEFEHACFGHGPALLGGARERIAELSSVWRVSGVGGASGTANGDAP